MPHTDLNFSFEKLNAADERDAVSMILPMIERSPETAAIIAQHRPFATKAEFINGLERFIREQDERAQIKLLQAHPELSPADPQSMTKESQSEQARLQLTSGSSALQLRLAKMNATYREKFGFPFIIALHRHMDIASVLSEFERRLKAPRPAEIEAALVEILSVSSARLDAALATQDKAKA